MISILENMIYKTLNMLDTFNRTFFFEILVLTIIIPVVCGLIFIWAICSELKDYVLKTAPKWRAYSTPGSTSPLKDTDVNPARNNSP